MQRKFLTRAELAARWRQAPHTLDNLANRGEGPPYRRIGRQALYDVQDIERYEATRLINPAKRPERSAA